jgi:hypothetical protein
MSVNKVILIGATMLLVLSLAQGVWAQSKETSRTDKLARATKKDATQATATAPVVTQSRKSFDELVARKDKDVLAYVHSSNLTYACFMLDEDVFVLVSYNLPSPLSWSPLIKDDRNSMQIADGKTLAFETYKNGVEDISRRGGFKWVKLFPDSDPSGTGTGFTTGEPAITWPKEWSLDVSITSATVFTTFSFENAANSTTNFEFVIQKSTKRFVKTLSVANEQFVTTGYCIVFPPVIAKRL